MDEAFEALCRREHPRVVGALGLMLADRPLAEELAQEALARAYSRWDQVQGMERPGAWVYAVALNLARSSRRRRAAEQRANARHGCSAVTAPDLATADGLAVRAAVAALPPRQREVVVLRFYLDLTLAETAAVLGTTVPAVKAHQTRASASLRLALPRTDIADAPEARGGP